MSDEEDFSRWITLKQQLFRRPSCQSTMHHLHGLQEYQGIYPRDGFPTQHVESPGGMPIGSSLVIRPIQGRLQSHELDRGHREIRSEAVV